MTPLSGAGRAIRVLPLVLATQIATMLPCFLMGSLFPLIRDDLGLAEGALGTMVAIFFASSALGSGLLASYADRFGPWMVARVSLAAAAVFSVALSFAPGVWTLAAMMGLAGLANGSVQPATNVALSSTIRAERQGTAFGLKQASVPLASLFAGLAVPIIALRAGWQAAYWLAAFLPVFLIFGLPRDQSKGMSDGSQPAPSHRAAPGWSRRTLVLVGVMSGLGAGSANAMAAFFVTSTAQQGLSISAAGMLLAFGSAISIAVRIVVGFVADKTRLPLLRVVAAMLIGGAVAYMLFAWGEGQAAILLATLLAFGMGWGWAGLSLLAIIRGNPGSPGRATGVVQSGLFCGAVIGPLSFGWIASHQTIATAWWVLGLADGFGAAIALYVSATTRQAERLIRDNTA